MRTVKEKATAMDGPKGPSDEDDYPHCKLSSWPHPYSPRSVTRYCLAASPPQGEKGIQAIKDRIPGGIREDGGRRATPAHPYANAVCPSGMAIGSDGQVDMFPDRSYPRD